MQTLRHIRIFLSSPGGLEEERSSVRGAARTINQVLEPTIGLSFDVMEWPGDFYSGVGVDGQQVINAQSDGRYDLYLGLVRDRVGTPTSRAPSGTIEEYEVALEAHRRAPGRVGVMWYLARDRTWQRPAELAALRDRLRTDGVLFHEYASPTDLEGLLMLHLPLAVRDLRRGAEDSDHSEATQARIELPDADASALLKHATEAMGRITAATLTWTSQMDAVNRRLDATSEAVNRAARRPSTPPAVVIAMATKFAADVRGLAKYSREWREACMPEVTTTHAALSRALLLAVAEVQTLHQEPELRRVTGLLLLAIRAAQASLVGPIEKFAALAAVIDTLSTIKPIREDMTLSGRQLGKTRNALVDVHTTFGELVGAIEWHLADGTVADKPSVAPRGP